MAVGKINLSLDADELRQMKASLGKLFDNKGLSDILGEALEKAIWPVFLRLREVTPEGPTGNLRRAVNHKVVKYPKDGNAVGLVGYNRAGKGGAQSASGGSVRAGPDRGFHQWWLEFGTQDRYVATFSNKPYQRKSHTRVVRSGKSVTVRAHQVSGQNAYIASSFERLGPFKVVKSPDGKSFSTDPAYPRAFFKKSKVPIRIPAMPIGGWTGRPPVQTAWNQTRGQVGQILSREIGLSLEAAIQKLSYTSTGSVTGATIQAGG